MVVDHHAGFRARWFFDIFDARVVNRHVLSLARLREIDGQLHRLGHRPVGRRPGRAGDDNVAAMNFLRVQPDVLLLRHFAGEKIVLPVVAADKNFKPVGRAEDHGLRRGQLHLFLLPIRRILLF